MKMEAGACTAGLLSRLLTLIREHVAVSSIQLSADEMLHISTSLNENATTDHHMFPDMMYEGVMYGVSAWNPEGKPSSPQKSAADNDELLQELQDMWPQPTQIMYRCVVDLSGYRRVQQHSLRLAYVA